MKKEPSVQRRLVAILAADIAGYSRLMGEDDAATVRDLKGHQAVILPLIDRYGGRIIDTAGDSILAEFPSVIGAVDDSSFDAFVRDLETVIEAAQVTQFALFGISQGCAIAIAYAVRYPERVSHLILYGGFAQGNRKRARSAAEKDADAAVRTLMRLGWGKENPAFRQLFTSQFMPGATKTQEDWFNELQRITVSPETAVRILEAIGDIDVTALLPQVRVPTLVMHVRDDAQVSFEAGRRMAAGIPGAQFVTLQGSNHLFLETEPAFGQFLEQIRPFLAS